MNSTIRLAYFGIGLAIADLLFVGFVLVFGT